MKKYFFFYSLLLVFFGYSQNLRLEDMMKGDEFIGHQPEYHRWSVDGQTILFDQDEKINLAKIKVLKNFFRNILCYYFVITVHF